MISSPFHKEARSGWLPKSMGRRLALPILAAGLLAGCSSPAGTGAPASSLPAPSEGGAQVEEPYDLSGLPELPDAAALDGLTPADFGCMEREHETEEDQYPLLEGTELELPVTVLAGAEEGPVLYVIGGVHGDELAGWYAGTLLKKAGLKAGTVYIAAPANRYGAEHDQRETRDGRDLNRNFPGDPEGCDAERIAYALYQDVADKAPDLLLDLHEARVHTDGRDNLGNSLICQDIQPIGDLVFALLEQSGQGRLGSQPLDLFGSPPQGSVNKTVTEQLGIPVITIETCRAEPLPLRVRNHLQLAGYILEWYGLR